MFVCMQTKSKNYVYGMPMKVVGVLWHTTGSGSPNPNLKRYVQPLCGDVKIADYNSVATAVAAVKEAIGDTKEHAKNTYPDWKALELIGLNEYGNDWNHSWPKDAGMNCWIGKLADGTVDTIQTMPWNYKPWGCGSGPNGSCNNGWVQFEICQDSGNDAGYFWATYNKACEVTAYICKKYGINPLGQVNYNGVLVPTILCHQDSYKLGMGGNHGDVYTAWFKNYGLTMDNVRQDVATRVQGCNKVDFTTTTVYMDIGGATQKPPIKTEGVTGSAVSNQIPGGSLVIDTGATVDPQEVKYGIALNVTVNNITLDKAELVFSTDNDQITGYSWTYRLVNVKTGRKLAENEFSVLDKKATIDLMGLTPDTRYFVEVVALDRYKNETKSPRIAFKTPAYAPVTIDDVYFELESHKVSFNISNDYTPSNDIATGYKLGVNINGQELVSKEISHKFTRNEKITYDISSLFKELSINVGDCIQVSILPWLKNDQGDKVYASQEANYSRPVYADTVLSTVNKLFLRVDDEYRQTILY